MTKGILNRVTRAAFAAMFAVTAIATPLAAARAESASDIESAFDQAFGTTPATSRQPARPAQPALQLYPVPQNDVAPRGQANWFEQQVSQLAAPDRGRIGVAALDLSSGRSLAVLGDQPFPMASTSKIAVAATFLEMVDAGRFSLTSEFPMMVPVPSRKFDGPVAPVRPGTYYTAATLIDLALTKSSNPATDALLAAIGGTRAVNDWLRRTGNSGIRIDRDIATLVRDDGAIDPATTIDPRDSTTPAAMVRLLAGLYQGQWLSPGSRDFLIRTMERCETGKRRIPGMMPEGVQIAHKTGTLANTASDVGIINLPDGRAIALAIYVTGQGGKPNRDARIAEIARAIYDGYLYQGGSQRSTAARK
jgi:beta-lactamase class A